MYEAVWFVGEGQPLVEGGVLRVRREVSFEQKSHGISFSRGEKRGKRGEGRKETRREGDREEKDRGERMVMRRRTRRGWDDVRGRE